uniref:Prothymosin alpha-like n=1 Tax=Scleropages formosus TaxID=113540 RepID=A0A8C9RZ30_SCLFO
PSRACLFRGPACARNWTTTPSAPRRQSVRLQDLKEKKLVEETENGKDAPANGKANEENGEPEVDDEEDEDEVGEEEDEDDDGDGDEDDDEDELEGGTKRGAEDDDDDEDDEVRLTFVLAMAGTFRKTVHESVAAK